MDIKSLHNIFLQHNVVTTDTRKISPGAIFFALKGDNFDGNTFARKAIESGCSYAVVDNPAFADDNRYIVVEDVLKTLQQLAAYHRRYLKIPILAITGTNGKTTSKELIGSVLSKKYNLAITQGNLNNHIGVPMTVLSMTKENDFAVIEMGANHMGEIAELCQIVKPDFGIVTNVGKAHLEGFGSFEGVMKAKGELYDYLQQSGGTAIVNTDDNILNRMVNTRKYLKVHPYSANIYQTEIFKTDNLSPFLGFGIKGGHVIETCLLGEYNLNNVLAAISIGEFLGLSINDISDAIKSYKPVNNRSQLIKTGRNIIYMDAYNANPTSMEVSLRNFGQLSETNKILILGDMLELGNESHNEHCYIMDLISELGFEKVYLVGEYFSHAAKNTTYHCYKSTKDFIKNLQSQNINNQTLLIKGSRGVGLEKIVEFL